MKQVTPWFRGQRGARGPVSIGAAAALCVLLWSPVVPAVSGGGAITSTPRISESPFALSSVGTGVVASTLGAIPGVDLTYNPYLAVATTVSLNYRLNKHWSVLGKVRGLSELTHPDSTVDRWVWQDSTLSLRGADLLEGLGLGLGLDTLLRLRLPTSRRSRARGERLEISTGAGVSRRVVWGLPLLFRYGVEASRGFTEGTTGAVALRLEGGCSGGVGCDSTLVSNGVMNLVGALWHRLRISAEVNSWTTVSFGTGAGVGMLYEPQSDPRISYQPPDASLGRYFLSSEFSVGIRPSSNAEILLGLSGFHPQVDRRGTRVPYFLNRYLLVYCTARIYIGALLADWLETSPKVTS